MIMGPDVTRSECTNRTHFWWRVVYRVCLTACAMAASYYTLSASATPSPVSLSFDFRNGALGWQAGFAEYPQDSYTDSYELLSEIRSLPPELGINGTGFYIQGNNLSDDLFMFLKRRLTSADGVVAGQVYQLDFTITFASRDQSGCVGEGTVVYLKAGAIPAEPLAFVDSTPDRSFQMNVDKGVQARSGMAASVIGNITNGMPCVSSPDPWVSVQRTHQHTSLVSANSKGELWLLVGTDSAYEGFTSLYYQRIDVTLTPVETTLPPFLLANNGTSRAAVIDSVTLKSEPFSVASNQNFSSDKRTRLTLFGYNLELRAGEDISAITVQAQDSQGKIYTLPVEAVTDLPNFAWIRQVTVSLPDELKGAGDVSLSISLRGATSFQAKVRIL
jgi:hypothetical protein